MKTVTYDELDELVRQHYPGVGETAGAIVLLAALLRIIYSILGWMIRY